MRRFPNKTSIAVTTAAALAAVGAASVATGAIPSGDGSINACYSSDGSLRVLDKEAGKVCNKGWTALSWNKQGVAGRPGPQGPQGEQGPQGAQGPAGSSGSSVPRYQRDVVEDVPPNTGGLVTAECDPGDKLVSGGFESNSRLLVVTRSRPSLNDEAWDSIAINTTPATESLRTFVICQDTNPGNPEQFTH